MKKVALLLVNSNPYFKKTVESICDISDEIHVKFGKDFVWDPYSALSAIRKLAPKKVYSEFEDDYNLKTNLDIQEKLLREIDRDNADLVIAVNSGEIFQPTIAQEISNFWKSDKLAMMFNYDKFITDDNRAVFGHLIYPNTPQMKVFKWRKKLSYIPYKGDCKIYNYRKSNDHWLAETKMQSYDCYTKDMEKSFIKHLQDIGELKK